MLRAIDIARTLCRRANPVYLAAIERAEPDFRAAGLYGNPLRLAHFLARVFSETGGLTVLVENMRYTTAARIRAVWPSRPEAAAFVGDPAGLANCVYAGRMGNGPPASGDGYRFRGRGPLQTTGRDAYRRYGRKIGLDLEADPDRLLDPDVMFRPALFEWAEMNCNALADRNAAKAVGNAINRGNPNAAQPPIGFADQIEWFDRIWAMMRAADAARDQPSWRAAEPDEDIVELQGTLVALGHPVVVDGRKGPETVAAIRAFQRAAGLPATGVADTATRTAMAARKEEADVAPREAPQVPDSASPPVVTDPAGKGGGIAAGGIAGEIVLQQAEKIETVASVVPWLRIVVAIVTCLGVALILYGVWRQFRPRPVAPS